MTEESTPEKAGIPYPIECRRSYLHRYIPADGVWLGLNDYGKIILNFYNDSPLLPKTVIPETTADGKKFTSKTAEIILESEAKSFRQYEVSICLSVAAAKFLVENLKAFIKMSEDREKENAPK
jgi:hypothetical protein